MRRIHTCGLGKLAHGSEFDCEFSPVTLIVGENFTGKTGLLDAIKLALLGWHPKLGKRNQDAMKLASAAEMVVDATFDDESKIRRSWLMDSKGSVKVTGQDHELVPALLLDAGQFLSLTGGQRTQLLFEAAGGELDFEPIADGLGKIQVLPLETSERITGQIHARLETGFKDVIRKHKTAATWFTDSIGWLKDSARAAENNRKSSSGNLTMLARQTRGPVEPDQTERLQEVDGQLANLRTKHGEALSLKRQQSENRARLERFRSAMSGAVTPAQVEQAEVSVTGLSASVEVFGKKLAAAKETANDLGRRYSGCESERANLARSLEELETLQQCGECPTCGGKVTGELGKVLKKRVKALTSDAAKAGKAAETFRVELKSAIARENELTNELKKIVETAAESVCRRDELKSRLLQQVRSEQEISAMQNELPGPSEEQVARIESEIEQLVEEVRELRAKQESRNSSLRAKDQRNELEGQVLRATCESEVFKQAAKLVEAEQKRQLEGCITGLVEIGNRLCDGILQRPLEFQDGELGWTVNNRWVSHDCFSGTEQLLAYNALSLALASKSKCRILLWDELARLDDQRAGLLVDRLLALIATGEIDQAILVDVRDRLKVSGVDSRMKVIRL